MLHSGSQCLNVLPGLGLILKRLSVSIHLHNVVWNEKLLVIAFALALWGWLSSLLLCFLLEKV